MLENEDRIHFIDELRGFCVLCMIFYHGFFTFFYVLNIKQAWKFFEFFTPVEPIFAGCFILISGICSSLSRSNIKRGVKLLIVALLVTVVTVIFVPEVAIRFGILHMLAISIILVGLLEKFLKRLNSIVGITIFSLLFCFSYSISRGYVGFLSFKLFALSRDLYQFDFLFPFGLPSASFSSSDYFPLIPWLFLFIAGFYVGQLFSEKGFPRFMYKPRVAFFSFLGRHALIIYIVHQPIIYGVAYVIKLCF